MITPLAEGLEDGENTRVLCPFCNGGSTSEKSFSLSKLPHGIAYRCFRDSCGNKGFIATSGALRTTDATNKRSREWQPRIFSRATEGLREDDYRFFEVLGFPRELVTSAGWKWCPSMERVAKPVLDTRGYIRGWVLRSYKGDAPKSLNYQESLGPFQCWFQKPGSSCVVVVEDIASALKVSQITTSVALLGTHMSLEKAKEIQGVSDNVVIALDPDAWATALKIVREYELMGNFSAVKLSKDPKNLTLSEIQEGLKSALTV